LRELCKPFRELFELCRAGWSRVGVRAEPQIGLRVNTNPVTLLGLWVPLCGGGKLVTLRGTHPLIYTGAFNPKTSPTHTTIMACTTLGQTHPQRTNTPALKLWCRESRPLRCLHSSRKALSDHLEASAKLLHLPLSQTGVRCSTYCHSQTKKRPQRCAESSQRVHTKTGEPPCNTGAMGGTTETLREGSRFICLPTRCIGHPSCGMHHAHSLLTSI
jgi:hypothetical protein